MRFVLHVFVAVLMGLLYWQTGEDAAFIYNNAGMIFFNHIFILYAALMPTVLTCNSRELYVEFISTN
jgi:hypothetical protein